MLLSGLLSFYFYQSICRTEPNLTLSNVNTNVQSDATKNIDSTSTATSTDNIAVTIR
jgi:hypothetical protein